MTIHEQAAKSFAGVSSSRTRPRGPRRDRHPAPRARVLDPRERGAARTVDRDSRYGRISPRRHPEVARWYARTVREGSVRSGDIVRLIRTA